MQCKYGCHYTLCCKCIGSLACLCCKMSMFQRVGMREGGIPLPLAFQYFILMIWRPCDLNMVMMTSLASKCLTSKCKDYIFGMPVFQTFCNMKLKKFKVLAFWSQWRYHNQTQIQIMLVGEASLPPSGTWAFYIIKRQNCVNICNTVYILHYRLQQIGRCFWYARWIRGEIRCSF